MANGGVWFKPHLAKMAAAPDAARKENWNPDNIAKVVSGMYGVVNEPGGTGDAARIPGITVSGKTGSAQRVSNELRKSGELDKGELEDNGLRVLVRKLRRQRVLEAQVSRDMSKGHDSAGRGQDSGAGDQGRTDRESRLGIENRESSISDGHSNAMDHTQ